MKFIFLFTCLMMPHFVSIAATSCVSNTGRGSCTFFPQTTIVIERPLGLTITNEEWYEANFNSVNNKFDDLPMSFTVDSTTGDSIAYSLTVNDSQHACYASVDGIATGEPSPIVVNLSIDGVNVSLDDPIVPEGVSVSREHQLTLHFSDDHGSDGSERICSGQIQIQAELAEI